MRDIAPASRQARTLAASRLFGSITPAASNSSLVRKRRTSANLTLCRSQFRFGESCSRRELGRTTAYDLHAACDGRLLRTRTDARPLAPGIIDNGSPLRPGHFVATCATGKRLICKVPLSAKPIMVRAPTSMQIVITRLLRSLILGNA
jgi:hypothetical protein